MNHAQDIPLKEQGDDLERRIQSTLDFHDSTSLQDKQERHYRPLAYDVAKVFGKKAARVVASSTQTAVNKAYNAASRAVWRGVIEPLGGLLSADLKLRLEERVGDQKFKASRATGKSYFAKIPVYAAFSYPVLTSGIIYDPLNPIADSILVGSLFAALEGVIRVAIDSLRSESEYELSQERVGDPLGTVASLIYKGVEKVASNGKGFLQDVMTEAREQNKHHPSGKVDLS